MSTESETTSALLQLTQWLSPAFPLGAFAYSHGLETAIADETVRDATSLERWLTVILTQGAGRSDAILLAHALRAPDQAGALADLAEALATSRERWQETQAQGAAFTRTVNAMTGSTVPERPLPVALGVAAAELPLAPAQVVALYLHSFMGNLASAGIRFIPLGQSDGQAVLARLKEAIVAVAEASVEASLEDIGSAAFGADLAAIRHEEQEVRLFRS
ncbi:urease accessory UreF family protein [Tropicimonas sp. TH_r6]|uniref:urease accessory protein UreF n=1 Tax=Tropicimonas sp. TH_r6 TaxID=3082085 RepID=UPI0029551D63|nr:urease accessory UreF family protein [Tropicimonas sp. TH_r6]MDV7145037.1 urease accessory UreF family protein [Tropicimonas sp. TH_r6]